MPSLRVVACVTAVLAAGVVSPATAAPKRCPLIVDPAGDATTGSVNATYRPELDILAADLKVVGKTFTTVIRLKRLPEGTQLIAGLRYDFYLTRDDLFWTVDAVTDATGDRFSVQTGVPTDPTSPYRNSVVSGAFDIARSQVTVTGPVSALTVDGGKGGEVFSELFTRSFDSAMSTEEAGVYSSVDAAEGTRPYRIGQANCF